MAKVRMHSPPARTVTKPNQRWDRQRPITRGKVSDHGGTPPDTGPLTITAVAPTTVPTAAAPTTTFTATGEAFVPGSVIRYKVGAAAEKIAATSTYISVTSYSFVIPAADLATAGTITWSMTVPSGSPVSGPSITRT